jgi:hypothetical protein
MKKILALAALTALSVSAFGQGQIQFNNRVTTTTPAVDALIRFGSSAGAPLSGTDTSFRAALIGGSTTGIPTTSDALGTLTLLASPTTQQTWVTFRTGAAAGYIAVGVDSARDALLPYGSQGIFQVVAWQGTQTTWAEAYQAWRAGQIAAGFSNPITSSTTTGPTDLAVPSLIGLNSFFIAQIPEPSSFALAGLGAAALLIFRRRK